MVCVHPKIFRFLLSLPRYEDCFRFSPSHSPSVPFNPLFFTVVIMFCLVLSTVSSAFFYFKLSFTLLLSYLGWRCTLLHILHKSLRRCSLIFNLTHPEHPMTESRNLLKKFLSVIFMYVFIYFKGTPISIWYTSQSLSPLKDQSTGRVRLEPVTPRTHPLLVLKVN